MLGNMEYHLNSLTIGPLLDDFQQKAHCYKLWMIRKVENMAVFFQGSQRLLAMAEINHLY